MSFFQFEIEHLKKIFPNESASLKDDFDESELEAIDEVGVLRGAPHLYLGMGPRLKISQIKNPDFSMTIIRF